MFVLLFIGFIFLILIRVPVSIAIGAAVLMTFLTSDFSDALYIIPQQILEGVNKPSLAAVPFFIMAGNLMNVVGMTDRIFNFANSSNRCSFESLLITFIILSNPFFVSAL